MRKGQDIKLNIAGQVSCLLLVLLLWMAIYPVAGSSAFAEESTKNFDAATVSEDNVTISFTPKSGVASLTPTTSDGASAKIDVVANVKIASTGGYSIYLGGQNAALTGASKGATIPGATAAKTFNELETNTWGYAYAEGDNVPDTATYSALPQGQGKILESVSGNNTNIDKTYALSFATKIGNDKPADVYENQVTLSVTSSPMEVTSLIEATYMQDMTANICESSAIGDTKQLIDKRDNKEYWVAKLKDNHCWMTQNLDLDIPASGFSSGTTDIGVNSYQNSDMEAPWTTPTAATTSTLGSLSADAPRTDSRSWDQGLYVLNTPTSGTNCDSSSTGIGLSNCTAAGFINVAGYTASTNPEFTKMNGSPVNSATKTYDAHYLVGNWYQWNAATAGTGDTIKSTGSDGNVTSEGNFTDAPSSICPRGWRLPTSGRNGSSSYQNATARNSSFKSLMMQYNSAGLNATAIQANDLVESPLFFTRSGYIDLDGNLGNAGFRAYYWPSTAYTTTTGAYYLTIVTGNNANPASNSDRRLGLSVRCVAR